MLTDSDIQGIDQLFPRNNKNISCPKVLNWDTLFQLSISINVFYIWPMGRMPISLYQINRNSKEITSLNKFRIKCFQLKYGICYYIIFLNRDNFYIYLELQPYREILSL